jgi:hypothetical protein
VVRFAVHDVTAAGAETIAWQLAQAMSSIGGTGGTSFAIHGESSIHVLPESFDLQLGEGLGAGGRDCIICAFAVSVPWLN